MTSKLLILLIISCISFNAWPQDNYTPLDKIANFPGKFIGRVNERAANLEAKLDRQTEKYLQRLLAKEKKLQRKLAKKDSAAASNLFGDVDLQYAQLINNPMQNKTGSQRGQYLPFVDSLKTSLSFLEQHSHIAGNAKDIQQSLAQVSGLQNKLQNAEQIKQFIRQRRQRIKETLSRYNILPKGLTKSYNDFNKEFYYYSQQIKEYKELLNSPDQLTQKALNMLSRLDVFQQFMKEHSELASIFGLPQNYGTPQSLGGLQTRSQVQQMIQTQLTAGGPNATQMLEQNLQSAQSQLKQLKEKIIKLGSGNEDMDMPDFKPNNQRTKSFLQRLEYGTNLQTTKSNYFFPTTSDLALSVGYKLNDKSTIGIGASYKMGWGKDIRHISITHEGLGLRSFFDMKIKGSFYASGGFEYNYQQPFGSLTQLKDAGNWQQSGLVGISKIVSLKTKFFKKTKLQLLWDFLSYRQTPETQAVKFRVGYNF